MYDVAVIGAGVSGLAVAHGLRRAGRTVVVLEASSRAGGVLQTRERDGFLMECAANGFLDKEPATRRLVDALGLTEALRPADVSSKKRFIYTKGRLRKVPSSPPAFLSSDIVPLGAKLRAAMEPFTPRSDAEDESLWDFGKRHLGEGITRVLFDAVQTGIFAGDAKKLSMAAAFPVIWKLEKKHRSLVLGAIREKPKGSVLTTFSGGMQTLIDGLVQSVGDSLRLGVRVEAMDRAPDGSWRVKVQGASEEVRAQRVVLACPADVSAKLLGPHAPAVADELEAVRYAPVTVVHFGFKKLEPRPEGFGFLVPAEEKRRVLGVLFISSFFQHRAPEGSTLMTVMMGGARDEAIAALSEAEAAKLARDELSQLIGLQAEPDVVEVVRWRRGIPQYEVGHLARMKRIDEAMATVPGITLSGNAYRGVGVNDCVREAERLVPELVAAVEKSAA